MTTVSSDPLIGHTLEGRYVIHSRIARGGMATVYMATDSRLHRTVAIKAMHPHLAEDPDFRNRFEQEARNAARLTHPNLVSVLDQGEEHDTVYLVMEYLPGITLRELMKQQRFLTTEQTFEVTEAVLAGLAAAHQAGIIHRDLKPENVLLADDGRIKLADFGLARPASANTGTGQALLGTIAYLSPELVTRGTADKQSDVYAFGIMMFEMLTGEQPFTGEQPMQIAYQHAHDDIPRPSTLSSQSTPELDEIVLWATSKDPTDRPADAAELLQAVIDAQDHSVQDQSTRVLHTQALTTRLPRTTHIDPLPAEAVPVETPPPAHVAPARPVSAPARAAHVERRRKKKGALLFVTTLMLAGVAATVGWWFGQGPGSLVTVPNVIDAPADSATATLADFTLTTTTSECTHVSIPPGHVVETIPNPDARVARESTVDLCVSIGPKILQAPDIVGLTLDEAQRAISDAGFEFGNTVEEQFSDEGESTVLRALTSEGDPLPDELPEGSSIDVVISAGTLPDISEVGVDEATDQLSQAGLNVDDAIGWAEHHESIEEGQVIYVYYPAETTSRGDSVGLVTSLGPELFEVPSVAGLPLQEAMDLLAGQGFDPVTLVPDALRGFAEVRDTEPAAGDMVPRGTEIRVRSTISL